MQNQNSAAIDIAIYGQTGYLEMNLSLTNSLNA